MTDPRPSQGFRQIDHTADLGFEFWAPTEVALLVEGARGLIAVMTDGAEIAADHEEEIEIDSLDPEDRLVRWLNAVLYAAVVDGFVLVTAALDLRDGGLTAHLRGAADRRSLVTCELKSVTYHDLRLEQHRHGWYARVVVDV
jgi:SHS2 domain-containing protein